MKSQQQNQVSVIITVKNDSAGLQKLLENLREQTQLPDEIVLSLAESSDGTEKVARDWAKKHKETVVVFGGSANRAVGRNLGFEAATKDILVSTDVGCQADSKWLESLVRPFSQLSPPDVVGGLTRGAPQSPWEAAQVPFVLAPEPEVGEVPLPATRNLAVTKKAFEKIGPFAQHLHTAEDYEWSRRALAKNVKIFFQPQAVVRWRPRATPQEYWSMIASLTTGDMQAQTWRLGHGSMIIRYVLFFVLIIITPGLGLFLWFLYGALKAWRLSQQNETRWSLTLLLQYLTDSAVLWGILSGLWQMQVARSSRLKGST